MYPAPTSLYSQKDTSACKLIASAVGSNICTLTLYYILKVLIKGF